LEGNAKTALKSPNSIVISERIANRFFGEEIALGKTIDLEIRGEYLTFNIDGVVKNSPENSTIQINLLVPFDYSKPHESSWLNIYVSTFFKINKGVNIANVEKKFDVIYAKEGRAEILKAQKDWNFDGDFSFKLQPLLSVHLDRKYQSNGGTKPAGNVLFSYFLSAIALFILIIACTNFINISISHSIQRAKEIGIRKVMGSFRHNLISQFMSESFLLCFVSFILSIFWLQIALPTFNALVDKSLAFEYLFDIKLFLLFIGIFLLTAFLAGFYPALILSSYQPIETLYGKFKLSNKNLMQKSLTVLQFGLATFFIVLTIVQLRQVDLFSAKPLGYNPENLVLINTHSNDKSKGEVLMNELRKNPNIVSVSARNEGIWNAKVMINGNNELEPDMNVVDDNYNNTLGLKMVEGRAFSKDFAGDSSLSVYVNEAFVKAANWKDNAIGQTISVMNRDIFEVIGVVKDYHFSSLYERVRPQVFTTNQDYGSYGTIIIRLSDSNIPKTLEDIKEKFRSVYPVKPFAYEFQSTINESNYRRERQMTELIKYSAGIMIFISCMGLFGLSMLSVEKRKKEIGIRKVLGASIVNIVLNVSFDFIKLVSIAFILFSPISYYVSNSFIEDYPYRVAVSVDIFLTCFVGLIVISLLTIGYQAINAASLNPVKSLKSE
jgi:putative ABC transport system permease protein